MSIEGIPDGWEQEKVGQISFGEYWVNNFGQPQRWDSDHPSSSKNYVIIRKKQKQYRPFANAAEFEPFRDRWIQRSSKHDTYDTIPAGCFRVTAYNDHHYWTGDGISISYEQAFNYGNCFDDGTPFGIEVTE